jgi:hypothetical protein
LVSFKVCYLIDSNKLMLLRFLIVLALMPAFFMACSQTHKPRVLTQACQDNEVVSVVIGPTPIPGGDAKGKTDITVCNQYFAASFAVETASPWGVAKGGILDIGIMRDGQADSDFVSLVDFMPNYWSAWPTSYQNVEVIHESADKVVVSVARDWGSVELRTEFEFLSDSKLVRIVTIMHNATDASLAQLTSGYIAWPSGGHLFGMPGITEGDSTPVSEAPSFAKWSASYDQTWAMGLHTPFSELIAYTGRDRYLKHNLAAGQTKQFEAWLQIEENANLAAFTKTEIQLDKLDQGRVFGEVSDSSNQILRDGAVVVLKEGRLHSWTLLVDGHYSLQLPLGDYQLFATAANYSPGLKQSVSVISGAQQELDLGEVQAPGHIEFSVIDRTRGDSLDAMISVARGSKPIVKYYGKPRFFTELKGTGKVSFPAAPGNYSFDVSSAGGFLSNVKRVDAEVISGQRTEIETALSMLPPPSERSWYAADLHHHSDVLDGFTSPEFVLRSQLAAGVDVAFLSDHDSTKNNAEMALLASQQGLRFIGGTELSASWGHFNAYPIDSDKQPYKGVGLLSVQEIFNEARRLGAEIIHVNHPYGNYGYFDSLKKQQASGGSENSLVPGGLNMGFDLIEITTEHEPQTLRRAWDFWNSGKPAYFTAGSDVHDVWGTLAEHSSGAGRSYVYISDELTVDSYVQALKGGHSYASQGPIVYPELVFGSQIKHPQGENLVLRYELQSVVGLTSVQLIERGQEIDRRNFKLSNTAERQAFTDLQMIEFNVRPDKPTWYSLVVEDVAGNYAYTNPLWVNTDKPQHQQANPKPN